MRSPTWVERLHLALWHHAIPFVFGPPTTRSPGPVDLHSATCSAVEVDGRAFLLTAAHVALPARDASLAEPTGVMAGPLSLDLCEAQLRTDTARDVATIALTSEQLALIDASDFRVVRPAQWPPPPLREGDGVLMAGYPGSWRIRVSWHELDFRAWTHLMLIHSIHTEQFVCHRDPAYSEAIQAVNEEVPDYNMAGCSGGPVFLVRNEGLLLPHLCGVISEASRFEDHMLVRIGRLHGIDSIGL